MTEVKIKKIPIADGAYEDGAEELLSSPSMSPYVDLITGFLEESDIGPKLREIAELPLEKRYVWRVASALKWAFADFSSINVDVDSETLSAEDRARITELLQRRPLQICLFLRSLVGFENMERMMHAGIAAARDCV